MSNINIIKVPSISWLENQCFKNVHGVPKIDVPERMSHLLCKVVLNAEKNLWVSFEVSPSTGSVLIFYSNLGWGPLSSYRLFDEEAKITYDFVRTFKRFARDLFRFYERRVSSAVISEDFLRKVVRK